MRKPRVARPFPYAIISVDYIVKLFAYAGEENLAYNWRESGKLFSLGCRTAPKFENFGTLFQLAISSYLAMAHENRQELG